MKAKYILIQGNKKNARNSFLNGDFFTWTAENLKSAFAFGNGTMKDFSRYSRDNAGNSTHIDIKTMKYIDTGKPCDITRAEIDAVFHKYGII
jgi:hypothetical protein